MVSDHDFEELPAPVDEMSFHAWQATVGKQNVLTASEKLYKKLEPYEITSGQYQEYQIKKKYGTILFVGLFIGLVFFVSAGSFLYFRLYMDLKEAVIVLSVFFFIQIIYFFIVRFLYTKQIKAEIL